MLLIVGVMIGGVAAWLGRANGGGTARRLEREMRELRGEVDARGQAANRARAAANRRATAAAAQAAGMIMGRWSSRHRLSRFAVHPVRRSKSHEMSLIVKICGLSTPEALDAALDAGADMVGFVFFPPSPRQSRFEAARALGERVRGRAQKVALTVDADDACCATIVEALQPDMLQLHGKETPARVARSSSASACR